MFSRKPIVKPLSWFKGMFSKMIIWKNWLRYPKIVPEREKSNWKFNNCWLNKRVLWFGPNNNQALPEILKFPVLTIIHALNHWSTDKLIELINQYLWGKVNKATKSGYLTCPTYPKYNPGKPFHTNGFHTTSPLNIFHNMLNKYVLVMVCMCSHCTKYFSCRQANAFSVGKDYPFLGNPSQTV